MHGHAIEKLFLECESDGGRAGNPRPTREIG